MGISRKSRKMSSKIKFRLLDMATADMAFEAFGSSLNELFENCALAVQDIMTDTKKIKSKEKITFEIRSEDLQSLLFDFLSEILFYKDTRGLVFSQFAVRVKKNEHYKLNCDMMGEKWDREKHEVRTEVKAVTYHLMEIKKNKEWRAQVVLDV